MATRAARVSALLRAASTRMTSRGGLRPLHGDDDAAAAVRVGAAAFTTDPWYSWVACGSTRAVVLVGRVRVDARGGTRGSRAGRRARWYSWV
eukprot:gene30979-18838_t